jgi:hypothetical protein
MMKQSIKWIIHHRIHPVRETATVDGNGKSSISYKNCSSTWTNCQLNVSFLHRHVPVPEDSSILKPEFGVRSSVSIQSTGSSLGKSFKWDPQGCKTIINSQPQKVADAGMHGQKLMFEGLDPCEFVGYIWLHSNALLDHFRA